MMNLTVKIEVRKQDTYGSNPHLLGEITTVIADDAILESLHTSVQLVLSDLERQVELRKAMAVLENAS